MSWSEKVSLMVTTIGLYNCARFVWTYQKASRGGWKHDPHGRYMMLTALNLGSLFALIISGRLMPGWPGRELVAIVLYFSYVALTQTLNRILEITLANKYARQAKEQARLEEIELKEQTEGAS